MEQTYYYIIIGALLGEYLLSTISSILNMGSISPEIPNEFQDVYDGEKYASSQDYLKAQTRFGLFSGTFSLVLILVVIHSGLFGLLDQFVRYQTEHFILRGLFFFGIIFIVQDIINLPFSIYSTFVIEERFGFNRTTPRTFIIDKLKAYALVAVLGSMITVPILYFFETFGNNGWWIAWRT